MIVVDKTQPVLLFKDLTHSVKVIDGLLGLFQCKSTFMRNAGDPDITGAQGFGILRHFSRFIDEIVVSYPEGGTVDAFFIDHLAQFRCALSKKIGEFNIGNAVSFNNIQGGGDILLEIFPVGVGDYSGMGGG